MLNNDIIDGGAKAAEYCGISKRTLYHLVEIGQVPAIRKGRRLFFRKSDLDASFSANAA